MVFRQASAILISNKYLAFDTEQGVMRPKLFSPGKISVVGCDQRKVPGIGKINQPLFDTLFHLQPMPLQLDIETTRKNFGQPAAKMFRIFGLFAVEKPAQRAIRPARQTYQTARTGLDLLQGDLCVPLFTGKVGFTDESHEIPVSRLILYKQNEAIRPSPERLAPEMPLRVVIRNIDLASDNRLDTLFARDQGKFHCTEKIVGICHCDRGHPVFAA